MTWHCSEYTRIGTAASIEKKSGETPQLIFSRSSGFSDSRARELQSTAMAVYPRAKNENELIPEVSPHGGEHPEGSLVEHAHGAQVVQGGRCAG
eukprot:943764-Pyramimonas_sp.AAC.1